MDARVVFSHSIRYLRDKAIEIIREVTGDDGYTAVDTQWVITVPAIWKPTAKQFMREAAYKVINLALFSVVRLFELNRRVLQHVFRVFPRNLVSNFWRSIESFLTLPNKDVSLWQKSQLHCITGYARFFEAS